MGTTIEEALSVQVDRRATRTVVRVDGEVDMATAPGLDRALEQAVDLTGRSTTGSPHDVEVDLSGVGFFGCAGATAVERADGRARSRGGRLRVVGAGRTVRIVLRTARLDRLVCDGQARVG